MSLTSMELSAQEAQEYTSCEVKPGDAPRYPYGLTLYLDNDSLAKLGISDLPKVGSALKLNALVTVTSIGMSQQQDGDAEMRTELQITDMELSGAGGSSPEQLAARLFPTKG